MTIHELQSLVPLAKAQFIETYQDSATLIQDTDVHILAKKDRTAKRQQIVDYCKARLTEDMPNEGESVIGKEHNAVILHAHTFKNADRFKHVLWHELGHVYSMSLSKELFDEIEADMLADHDTLIRNGMAVWSEFVAETIAYIVEDADPMPYPYQQIDIMVCLMDEAVNSGNLQPYPLALFMAMAFEDPTILAWSAANDNAVPGVDHCDDDVIPLLKNLTNSLGRQWEKDDYLRIDRQHLEEIGECVNDLWTYCYEVGSLRRHLGRMTAANVKACKTHDCETHAATTGRAHCKNP